jgi:hypothetical protein
LVRISNKWWKKENPLGDESHEGTSLTVIGGKDYFLVRSPLNFTS